jgi:hypothetical protein
MTDEWRGFLQAADEWLINYLSAPNWLINVKLFSIGHSFELYLKAIYAHGNNDIDGAVKYGHRLDLLWKACKALDPPLLPAVVLRDSVLAEDILHGGLDKRLDRDDFLHFLKYQELYLIVRHLPDLKYIGAPLKSANYQLAYAFSFPNEMWADILHGVRRYLRLTQPSTVLIEAVNGNWLTQTARAFLAHILDDRNCSAGGA